MKLFQKYRTSTTEQVINKEINRKQSKANINPINTNDTRNGNYCSIYLSIHPRVLNETSFPIRSLPASRNSSLLRVAHGSSSRSRVIAWSPRPRPFTLRRHLATSQHQLPAAGCRRPSCLREPDRGGFRPSSSHRPAGPATGSHIRWFFCSVSGWLHSNEVLQQSLNGEGWFASWTDRDCCSIRVKVT